jgi:L,D-peptidoglycan transpeptidase YkuD (ErfK/YbiS/YcfS/YnhG family)
MMIDDESTAIIRVLNRLPSQQAVVVIGRSGFKADLNLYEHNGTEWSFIRRMPANIGGNGMGKTREGDQRSPSGIFSLGIAFGIAQQPEGTKYPYVLLTPQDYWVSDSKSKDYNRWVHYREGEGKGEPRDWQNAERLVQETICYRYAVVINYNCAREPEKGSAIFLHVWRNENTPTQGCTAVSEADMVQILQWLDPQYAPVFIQGTLEDIVGRGERT